MMVATGHLAYPLVQAKHTEPEYPWDFIWRATTWTREQDPVPWNANCCLEFSDVAIRLPMNYEVVVL